MRNEQPTRTELTELLKEQRKSIKELETYLNGNEAPNLVRDTLQQKLEELKTECESTKWQISRFKASCMFCKEEIETEVLTKAFICDDCDKRARGVK